MWHEDLSGAVAAIRALDVSSEAELRERLADPEVLMGVVGGIRIVNVNVRLVELLGGSKEEHLAGIDERFATPEWYEAFLDALAAVWRGEHAGASSVVLRAVDGDLRSGTLEWFAPPGLAGPDWENVVITFVDSTERDRLARVVAMVSAAERAVLTATCEEEMLAEVCRIIVDRGGFLMAWAGFAEPEPPHRIIPVATAGYDGFDPGAIRVNWDDSELGMGPSGLALRDGVAHVVNDVGSDPSYAPWREAAMEAGVAASVALPVIGEGVRGVLSVKADRIGAFGDDEMDLLSRLARTVTTGIAGLRTRRQLELARASLEGIIEEKDQFLASIAHELRTPLASVLGFAEILSLGGARAPGEVAEFARLIAGSAEELSGVVDDLLIAAREHPDSIRVSPIAMDLSEEVAVVLRRMRRQEARVVGADPVRAFADPARVRQVLRNLFTNAARYGGANVEVRLGTDGGSAWVEVADDGPEIDPAHVGRMFDAYVQSGSLSPEPMGLGLFICRRLAGRMGGTLEFERQGTWNIFRLSLPRQHS